MGIGNIYDLQFSGPTHPTPSSPATPDVSPRRLRVHGLAAQADGGGLKLL